MEWNCVKDNPPKTAGFYLYKSGFLWNIGYFNLKFWNGLGPCESVNPEYWTVIKIGQG